MSTTTPTDTTGSGGFPPSGYNPPPSGGFDTATHTVVKGDTLALIARRYGCSYQEIAQWNGIAPPYTIHPGQRLRISSATSSTTMGAMSNPPYYNPSSMMGSTATAYPVPVTQPPAPISPFRDAEDFSPPFTTDSDSSGEAFYVVQPGESLYGIASRFGHSLYDVAAWNSLNPPYDPLTVGRRLQITPPPGWMSNRNVATGGGYYNTPPIPNTSYSGYDYSTPPISKPTRTISPSGNTSYHTVRAGDTLYNIAKRYGRSVAEVATWNGFSEPYPPISIGQTLSIKAGKSSGYKPMSFAPTSPAVTGSGYHTVAPGDTLYNIAKRYGQSIAQLAALNNMQPPYPAISIGQRLRTSQGRNSSSSFRTYGANSSSYSAGTRVHRVKPGETLYSVARLYGTTTGELAAWNGIGHPYAVFPGQSLRVVPP